MGAISSSCSRCSSRQKHEAGFSDWHPDRYVNLHAIPADPCAKSHRSRPDVLAEMYQPSQCTEVLHHREQIVCHQLQPAPSKTSHDCVSNTCQFAQPSTRMCTHVEAVCESDKCHWHLPCPHGCQKRTASCGWTLLMTSLYTTAVTRDIHMGKWSDNQARQNMGLQYMRIVPWGQSQPPVHATTNVRSKS